jgi:hypothetical protein
MLLEAAFTFPLKLFYLAMANINKKSEPFFGKRERREREGESSSFQLSRERASLASYVRSSRERALARD